MPRYSDGIIHSDISDNMKVLLGLLAENDGSMDELDLQKIIANEWGESMMVAISDELSVAVSHGWLKSSQAITLTNSGWAIVEGQQIQRDVTNFVGDGSVTPDWADRWTPCFVYEAPSNLRSPSDYEEIGDRVEDAASEADSNARPTHIQEEPSEMAFLIVYE